MRHAARMQLQLLVAAIAAEVAADRAPVIRARFAGLLEQHHEAFVAGVALELLDDLRHSWLRAALRRAGLEREVTP